MEGERADRRVVAHLFVADVEQPVIAEKDRHHVERVLRLRAGEALTVADGNGAVRLCSFAGGGLLEPAGEIEHRPKPEPAITVGFALVKGGRPEWIVQKLTECGVDRIVPFRAARSIVQWDETKAERQRERLSLVAREAAMQSRQARVPAVEAVSGFVEVVAAAGPVGVALADLDGDAPTLAASTVLVGPEGGWTPEERALVGRFVRFGPTQLRAETAALAAGIVLSALRAGVVEPAYPRAARSFGAISSP